MDRKIATDSLVIHKLRQENPRLSVLRVFADQLAPQHQRLRKVRTCSGFLGGIFLRRARLDVKTLALARVAFKMTALANAWPA